ncbi:MAG TPA: FAD-dependent oxidoreductase, partial [Beijerinckiaceae bacterium]
MIESRRPLRIAVVGAGVSGLSAAWLLSSAHDVVVYEAAPRLGGHANTRVVDVAGRRIAVDAGFIVYNELTYPNFVALLDHLDVASKPTDMSFAVSIDDGALEYCGSGLAGLFAQRRNILNPRFLVMLRDLVRFYRTAVAELPAHEHLSLDAFLDAGGYGRAFREDHLYPMAAAIWSTPAANVGAFPAATFISFCENHRLLSLGARPVWRTVEGGAFRYVDALAQPLGAGLRLATAVVAARRRPHGVELRDATGGVDVFDHVVFAT